MLKVSSVALIALSPKATSEAQEEELQVGMCQADERRLHVKLWILVLPDIMLLLEVDEFTECVSKLQSACSCTVASPQL